MSIYKPATILLFSILAIFVACNDVDTRTVKHAQAISPVPVAIHPEILVTDIPGKEVNIFPPDSFPELNLLATGTFHEDEVSKNAAKEKWFGLFRSADGYYLQQTSIKTIRVNDPVLDEEENDKTGWEVSTENKDTNFLLIKGMPFLQDRKIQNVSLAKDEIYPGDTVHLSFSGMDYKIFATGNKTKREDSPEVFDYTNYKLYLLAIKDGKEITQLLVARPDFDDNMIKVIFAGDIDGDGILDLLIDTAGHYNSISLTLYLSKPAGKNEILKLTGRHTRVGC